MDGQVIAVIIVGLIISIGAFLALRVFFLWYFGISDIIKELKGIRAALEKRP